MEAPYDLPDGWRWALLDDVCERVTQVDPRKSPSRLFQYVDISAVDTRANRIAETKAFRGAEAPSRARKPIQEGDVLFATVRTYLRNVATVPPELNGEIASTGFCVLRPGNEIHPGFLFRYVLTDEFIKRVSDLQRGISYPAVTDRDVYSQPVPLPPLPEQRRIAEKIEQLLEQSRTAREALDRIPPLLKRFRQSVLAEAFRGELTERDPNDEPASVLLERIREERRRKWEEDLRAKGKDPRRAKYVEPEPPGTSELPELPAGWLWIAMAEVIASMKNGIYRPASVYGSGTPCLRMYNIEDGRIVLRDLKLMRLDPSEVKEYGLLPGDVLVNRVNSRALVGKCAIVPDGLGDIVYESKNIRLRVDPALASPRYVALAINSRSVRDLIETRAKQTVGMATINQADIEAWPLPLPPIKEQRRISAMVDALFVYADTIELAVAKGMRRAEHVDQAVLARAFRGEL